MEFKFVCSYSDLAVCFFKLIIIALTLFDILYSYLYVIHPIFLLMLSLFYFIFRFNRLRNDGSFIAKANCAVVATIRELPSSKENYSNNNKHNNNRYNNSFKSSQVTTRMTETYDGHTIRHRAPFPPVEVSVFLFFLILYRLLHSTNA